MFAVFVQTDAMSKLREQINSSGGPKISVNDFVIKAAALALRKVWCCAGKQCLHLILLRVDAVSNVMH